jgi:hypothetical protein
MVGGQAGPKPQDLVGFPFRPSCLRDRPVLAPAGARYDHAEWPDDVSNVGCLRRVRARDIREQVKSGLGPTKAQGKVLGRPTIEAEKEAAIRADLIAAKVDIMKLAVAYGLAWERCSRSRRRWWWPKVVLNVATDRP